MLCPSCGHENPEDAKFCRGCGTSAQSEVACPDCGSSHPAGGRFCSDCGQLLTEAAPPTRTPTPAPSPALPAFFACGRYQVKRFLGERGRKQLKGIKGRQRLYEVAWREGT